MSASTFSIIQQVLVFIAGCCLGSFFNVVIRRLPAKESIAVPGSHCPGCKHPIGFYDNIPLLSYVVLGGKCRHCGERISIRYPLVEALTGALTLFVFLRYGFQLQFFVELLLVSLLVIITFIDLDTYLIPDVLSLPGILMGFGLSFVTPRFDWFDSLLGILIGGGFFFLIAVGYKLLRRQEGLGGGDIKLLAMIGAFLGWCGVGFTVLMASCIGTLVGLVIMIRSRQGLTAMLPFGPFLALGAISYLFWGQSFIRWYLHLFTGMP
ncbi:MAG: prepilin peptidase [Syntrophobacteraceae bacterium]